MSERQRFETDDEVNQQVTAVYALTANLKRGDVLEHTAIAEVLGFQPHEDRWQWIMERVRRRLEQERGISVLPERIIGYRLLTPEETLNQLTRYRLKKAKRQTTKARKSVMALPEKGLSVNLRRVRAATIDAMRESERRLQREIHEQQKPFRPTPTMPKRVMMPARPN